MSKDTQNIELYRSRFREFDKNRLSESSFLKWVSFVQKHYQCILKWIHPSELANYPLPMNINEIKKARYFEISNGTQLYFPLFIEGGLKGIFEINSPQQPLTSRQKETLADILQDVIGPTLYASDRLELLETLESSLRGQPLSRKVVSIFPWKEKQRTPALTTKKFTGAGSYPPCFVEAKNYEEAHKTALRIHEFTKNFAFILFDQLNREHRESAEVLSTLGPVTLFVPDLLQLSGKEISSLSLYLSFYLDKLDTPQIISSASTSLGQLISTKSLPMDFLLKISSVYVSPDLTLPQASVRRSPNDYF